MLRASLESLRPRQWSKNLILFAPLVFAQRALEPGSLLRASLAFAVYCGLSGAVYVFNDLRDAEQDRRHPAKRLRPIASERLGHSAAWLLALGCLGLSLTLAWRLGPGLSTPIEVLAGSGAELLSAGGRGPSFFAVCLTYFALTLGYTLWLKHVVILDVLVLAIGFVLRAVAGAVVIGVDISHWLLVCTVFLALFLGLAKRRHEVLLLEQEASGHRRSLGDYNVDGLDQMISIVAAVTLVSYALYTTDASTVAKFGSARLSLTIPLVIYGIFRYIYLVQRRDGGGDPSQSLLGDRPLLVSVALWGLAVLAIVYA